MSENLSDQTIGGSKNNLLDDIERVMLLYSKQQGKKNVDRELVKRKIKKHLAPIAKTLGITRPAALLFSHVLEVGSRDVTPQKLASSLKCSNIRFLKHMNSMEILEKKGLVFQLKNRHCSDISYVVPFNVIQSIRKGNSPAPEHFCTETTEELFKRMDEIFLNRIRQETSFEYFNSELFLLLNDNVHLEFCRAFNEYKLSGTEAIFILFLCRQLVLDGEDSFNPHNDDSLKEIFGIGSVLFGLRRGLRTGGSSLFEKELIEYAGENGFRGTKNIQVTKAAKEKLLDGIELKSPVHSNKHDLLDWKQLKEKPLFYNKEEAAQVARLSGLLGSQNYSGIVSRLSESNMRTGFACLFSGPPGTGKTETAYQLAKTTGRDIMPVDIANSKSMWFGESEKIIKDIFKRYRCHVEQAEKNGENVPILLFNEADAVIGKRRTLSASRNGPDQTENTIQNIILEEMENLKGILIATTNLTQNMDTAFERRFLFKINFAKPTLEARKNIWQSLMPMLSTEDCDQLSYAFDLSGGQIENIARKYTVETVLAGTAPALETVMTFCRDETIGKNSPKIGFAV